MKPRMMTNTLNFRNSQFLI